MYIGELEHPKKEIKEGDNDTAHIDEAAPQVIRYIKATPDHEFLINQTLKITEGVTPEIFNVAEAPPAQSNDPGGDEANKEVKKEEGDAKKPVEEDEKGIVYRPQVTSEPKMKYFKVPRLGCYMAVPLIYSSCLFPESLDGAIAEYVVYMDKVKKNEEQIKAWEDQCAQLKAEREEQLQEISKTEEKVEGAPPREELKLPEKPALEQPKEADYKTKLISYVVCLDTLGQDKEFSKEQRKFVIETVKKFKLQWELKERERLTSDRKLRDEEKEKDTKELETVFQALQDEEDKEAESYSSSLPEEMSEEDKKWKVKMARWKSKVKQIESGPFKERILVFRKYNVIKLARIMQSLFYFLGFEREDICEPGTNKIFWKIAKLKWNEELLSKLSSYVVEGSKEGKYLKYQKLNFVEKNLEGITDEEVQNYSQGLAKLFTCLKYTLELRKEDIARRKENREKKKKEEKKQFKIVKKEIRIGLTK